MKLGVNTFVTDRSIAPDELAREVEARGFESLFVPEKTHLPVSRRTPWPGGPELPEDYKRTYDPFVALAAAAAVTRTLRIGTGICIAAARDPIVLAKEIASLDTLSGGRFIFGIGYGWNAEEMDDHGVGFDDRHEVLRDKIAAMKAIWTQDEASYDGKYVSFEPMWSWPKPVQKPHPPILMGSRASPAIFRDIAEYCDGWMPIEFFGRSVEKMDDLRRAFDDGGRDPTDIDVTVMMPFVDEPTLERYIDAGVTRALLPLPSEGADAVLPVLDEYTRVLGAVAPAEGVRMPRATARPAGR